MWQPDLSSDSAHGNMPHGMTKGLRMSKRGQNTNYTAVQVGGAGYQLFEHYWRGRTYIRARVGKTYTNRSTGTLSVIPEFDDRNADDVARAVELAKEALAQSQHQTFIPRGSNKGSGLAGNKRHAQKPADTKPQDSHSSPTASESPSMEVYVAKGIPLARITPVKMAVSAEEYYASQRRNDD